MKTRLLMLVTVLFFCSSDAFAQETITITTYYPSPYGSYQDLSVNGNISFTNSSPGDAAVINSQRIGANGTQLRITSGGGTEDSIWLGGDGSPSSLTGTIYLNASNIVIPSTTTMNICLRFLFTATSDTTPCPASYAIPMAPLRPENQDGSLATSGSFLCCKFVNG